MNSKPLKTREICDWYSSGDQGDTEDTEQRFRVIKQLRHGIVKLKKIPKLDTMRITKLKAERPKVKPGTTIEAG